MSLRIARSFLLLITAVTGIIFNQMMGGFSALFGIALSISALLTVAYLFINLNKEFNPNVILELVADGFSGIVIFTYPQSDESFFMVVFAFWIVIMGGKYLGGAVRHLKEKQSLPAYLLGGIMMIVLGFIIINYTSETENSVNYLIGFATIIYTGINIFLYLRNKTEV